MKSPHNPEAWYRKWLSLFLRAQRKPHRMAWVKALMPKQKRLHWTSDLGRTRKLSPEDAYVNR